MSDDDADLLPDYAIRLRTLPGGPAEIRLKRALKTLLRAFGFKCLSAVEVPRETPPPLPVSEAAPETNATETEEPPQLLPAFIQMTRKRP